MQQFKSSFKTTITWNKYQSKVTIKVKNSCLDYLFHPIFRGANKYFALWLENNDDGIAHTEYFLPKVEKKITIL